MIKYFGSEAFSSSFAKRRNLPNVIGRIDYISNPKRQEFLEDHYNMEDKDFWKELAKQSIDTKDYNKTKTDKKGKPSKPIQAVEYIVRLSPEMYDMESQTLLVPAKVIADSFYQKFGYKCCVGVHHSKLKDEYKRQVRDVNGKPIRDNNNLHCHVIICDRQEPKERIKKYATRDIFFDSNGKRVYKKSLADPSKTIKKGECYKDYKFGTKIAEIRDNLSFNEKIHEWSNELNNQYSKYVKYARFKDVGKNKDYEPHIKYGKYTPLNKVLSSEKENHEIDMLNQVKFTTNKHIYKRGAGGVSSFDKEYSNESVFYVIDADETLKYYKGEERKQLYRMGAYINRRPENSRSGRVRNDFPYSTIKGFHGWVAQNQRRIEEEIEKYLRGSIDEYEYEYGRTR